MSYRLAIINVPTNASKDLKEDKSVAVIREKAGGNGFEVVSCETLTSSAGEISDAISAVCDNHRADLLLTVGGTGIKKQDNVPEATLAVLDKVIPGIPEALRIASLKFTPKGMLARGVSGIRGDTLIVNLPGSPRAVEQILDGIFPVLTHAVNTLVEQAKE